MYNTGFYLWEKFDDVYLLSNDLGQHVFLDPQVFLAFQSGALENNDAAFSKLKDNGFIYEGNRQAYVREWKDCYTNMKRCLLTSTQLFILALTTACNQQCIYCQAGEVGCSFAMSREICKKALDIAAQSPTSHITIEFQGGEPTLNPEILRFAIPYAKRIFADHGKRVSFAIVTNLSSPDPVLLDWLIEEGVNISTSLDGHRELHDSNRPLKNSGLSYDRWLRGLSICRSLNSKHGVVNDVGAIQTTTRESLGYASNIVEEYIRNEYHNLYIRPLTPLGCASEAWGKIGYSAEEYLEFYLSVLDDLFLRCKNGYFITETTASIYLTRILCHESVGHTEFRSPCGAAVGQMAINYDGQIYTCDEGRMLANMGDNTFRLGDIDNTYEELVASPAAHATCTASCVETLPLCSGCVYQPFCSVCPVVTYSIERDLVSHNTSGYRCTIAKGILRYLFRRIRTASKEEMEILYQWTK